MKALSLFPVPLTFRCHLINPWNEFVPCLIIYFAFTHPPKRFVPAVPVPRKGVPIWLSNSPPPAYVLSLAGASRDMLETGRDLLAKANERITTEMQTSLPSLLAVSQRTGCVKSIIKAFLCSNYTVPDTNWRLMEPIRGVE